MTNFLDIKVKSYLNINIKLLYNTSILPTYAHDTDAGLDLYAHKFYLDGDKVVYTTGIALEIPEGHVGLIFPRSSIYKTNLSLANSIGVLDSGFRDEIRLIFNINDRYKLYNTGDRIGQLIILPYPKINLQVVDQLSDSDRGIGGFGSTGE